MKSMYPKADILYFPAIIQVFFFIVGFVAKFRKSKFFGINVIIAIQ
jgi:hypothetical protein